MKSVKILIKDSKGATMATADVMRSGKYVGLDFTVPGPEHGGFSVSLDHHELADLVSALVTVQADVMRSGKYVELDFTVPGPEHGGFSVSLDHHELADLVSALVTVQAEVIDQNS